MDAEIHGLLFGCGLAVALFCSLASTQQTRTAALMVHAAHALEWRDLRLAMVCAEGNPAADVCGRPGWARRS